MKRKIISINENLCNGCGQCIPNCPEGAIQLIDGKARLISDIFCDGLGACIGHCPVGAISIEEREAEEYNEKKTMANIVKQGENTIKAHLLHLKEHGEMKYLQEAIDYLKENKISVPILEQEPCGCPSSNARILKEKKSQTQNNNNNLKLESELRQWPIQLQLLNPMAQYFDNADLLIAADCVPFTYADFHRRFLKDKIVIVFCPKLDRVIDQYIEKLTMILQNHNIKSITTIHMVVPCCGGINYVVEEAVKKSGKNIIIKDYTISLEGEIM